MLKKSWNWTKKNWLPATVFFLAGTGATLAGFAIPGRALARDAAVKVKEQTDKLSKKSPSSEAS